jgi:hypothetical protein
MNARASLGLSVKPDALEPEELPFLLPEGSFLTLGEDERECPRCAETIKARAKVCRFCGHDLELAAAEEHARKVIEKEQAAKAKESARLAKALPASPWVRAEERERAGLARRPRIAPDVDPRLAVALSFLCIGLGQFYCGKLWRGVGWFLSTGTVVAVFVLVSGHPFGREPDPGSFLLSWAAGLALWILNMLDAYACATDPGGTTSGPPRW